ncbi:MAG: sigma factor, partial [Actinomycetota bacterium]
MARQRNATPSLHHYLDRLPRRSPVDGGTIRFAGDDRTGSGRTSNGRTSNGRSSDDRTGHPEACGDRATQLSLDNLGLVVSIARRYWFDGVDLDDLIQAGNVGLLRAAASFEPDHGLALATWLSFGIRQAMLDH